MSLTISTAVALQPVDGSLSGFSAVCSCGLEVRSSIEFCFELDKAAHMKWAAEVAI